MTTSHDERLTIDAAGRGIWFGSCHVPWAVVTDGTFDVSVGRSRQGGPPIGEMFCTRQALIPFENGLQLSVAWGSGTYSDNHDHFLGREPFVDEPAKVELAILGEDGLLDLPNGDTVVGYVPVAELGNYLNRVAQLPSGVRALPAA